MRPKKPEEHENLERWLITYADLIDMKINALDLLDDPRNYGIDEKERRVVMKK